MRCWRSWILLASLASLCSSQAEANAQTAARVELTLAGNEGDVRALDTTLSEALTSSSVQLHATRVTAIEPRKISHPGLTASRAPHLWIDATATKHATLYLTSADGSHVFVRQFELERGLDPVALELLALVAHSSLSAMLAGDSVGVSREEYERSLPATQAPTKKTPNATSDDEHAVHAKRARPFHFGALYELEGLGPSAALHGARAQLEWQPSWISLGLSAALRAPVQVGSGPVQVRLTSRSAQLFAAVPLSLSERASLALGSAFGLDWTRVEGLEQAPNARPEPAYSVTDSVLRVFGAFRYRLAALELSAGLGADFGLVDSHYYVLRGVERETVFTPWRVRPLATLGLSACF